MPRQKKGKKLKICSTDSCSFHNEGGKIVFIRRLSYFTLSDVDARENATRDRQMIASVDL
jgi:hypothetical protein